MKKILLLIIITSVVSCETVKTTPSNDFSNVKKRASNSFEVFESKNAPLWAKKSGTFRQGKNLFAVGSSYNVEDEQKSREAAFTNGFSELAMHFGIDIKSTLTDFQQDSDGEYSYETVSKSEITAKPIKINRFVKADEFIVKKDGRYSTKVLIRISQKEADKIEKEIKGITAWNIYIKDLAYENEAIDFVKKYASANRINLGNRIIIQRNSPIEEISKTADTAYFMNTEVSWSEIVNEGKAYFTKIKISLSIYSLTEEKEIKTVIKELKWGEYSSKDVVKKGIKKLTDKIIKEEID